jgi:hypothetical protein
LNHGYFIFKFKGTPSLKFNKTFFSILTIAKISLKNQISPLQKTCNVALINFAKPVQGRQHLANKLAPHLQLHTGFQRPAKNC